MSLFAPSTTTLRLEMFFGPWQLGMRPLMERVLSRRDILRA